MRERYQLVLNGVLAAYQGDNYALAQRMFVEQLTPAWFEGRKQLNALGAKNKVVADRASDAIQAAVSSAKITLGISLIIALLAAAACGLLLMRAILAPMNRIVQILDTMRTGDLSSTTRPGPQR